MTRAMFAGLSAALVLSVAAHAETPPAAQPASAATKAPESAAAAPAARAAAPAEGNTSAAVAAERVSLLQQAHAQGYRPVTQGGKTVYCKSEKVIGTRFEQRICATEEQLVEIERKAIATQEEVGQRMR